MKWVKRKFNGSQRVGERFFCACCLTRLTYGYVLNTGEVIDGHCRTALRALKGHTKVNEHTAYELKVSKHQVEFFGLIWIEPLPAQSMILTAEERERLDRQALQDEKDLFG